MRRFADPVLGQLRRPHGPLAPLTARLLNIVNRPINWWAVRALALSGDEDVLDVGFGGGIGLALVLRDLRDGRATGIDVSWEMVQRAAGNFRDSIATGRLRVVCAGVEAIPLGDQTVDRVYTVNSVFFWPDGPASFRELRRVLRPGGRLVVAAPLAGFALARATGLAPPSGIASMDQVGQLIEDAGFVRVRRSGRAGASLLVAEG